MMSLTLKCLFNSEICTLNLNNLDIGPPKLSLNPDFDKSTLKNVHDTLVKKLVVLMGSLFEATFSSSGF